MSITEVIPLIEIMPHKDKFQLVQILISQLAGEEGITLRSQTENQPIETIPKPIGRTYYSGRSDISTLAKEELFKEKLQRVQSRQKSCCLTT